MTGSTVRVHGFTLAELLVTLVIIGIMLMLALPAMGSWNKRQQLQNAVDDLTDTLRLARQHAITSQQDVWVELTTASAAQWELRVVSTTETVASRSSASYGAVTLARQGGSLPLKFAFSPLRGMPVDNSSTTLNEVKLSLGRSGCSSGTITLLVTGFAYGSKTTCD
ncbi:GspH/FimT family pseudopilin [Vogesella fluminis]|uniref:Type II secretion system protein H n=1 Tax=Vogesella fluminis TaxID=1069161 RepID=A0ABQ3HAD3_9NEIS|nr:GspH/FimT family pseudopilin [Vogesella fluminis]GHD76128.1 hypothetical protein GCM10011419_15010 [Vogesella fluminis]